MISLLLIPLKTKEKLLMYNGPAVIVVWMTAQEQTWRRSSNTSCTVISSYLSWWRNKYLYVIVARSDTYTLPDRLSIARPSGIENWPSPSPSSPHWVMNVPSLVNFCTCWLPESVTYTFPLESKETTAGPSNSPRPVPDDPQEVMNSPSVVNICIRSFPWICS